MDDRRPAKLRESKLMRGKKPAKVFALLLTPSFPMKRLRGGSPAVNNPHFDPGIILPSAAEVRAQILGLAPERDVLIVAVISTPSQRHREAVRCHTTPREMLSSKQHLRERRQPPIRSVADPRSEQIVDVVERGAPGFLAY